MSRRKPTLQSVLAALKALTPEEQMQVVLDPSTAVGQHLRRSRKAADLVTDSLRERDATAQELAWRLSGSRRKNEARNAEVIRRKQAGQDDKTIAGEMSRAGKRLTKENVRAILSRARRAGLL